MKNLCFALGIAFAILVLGQQNLAAQHSRISISEDVSLYYKDWGKGKPLIFLYSWGVNSDI